MVLSWFASKLNPIAVDIGTDTIKLLQVEPRDGQARKRVTHREAEEGDAGKLPALAVVGRLQLPDLPHLEQRRRQLRPRLRDADVVYLSDQLEPEDGKLWVNDVDGAQTLAFSEFVIETLREIIADQVDRKR